MDLETRLKTITEDRLERLRANLDDAVHDAKADEASVINNCGVREQLRSLFGDRDEAKLEFIAACIDGGSRA